MLHEAQDLLMNSPWITSIERIDESSTEIKNIEPVTLAVLADYSTDVNTVTDIQLTGDDLDSDNNASDNISHFKTSHQTSVIPSPDLSFSSEEMQFIKKNDIIHNINLKRTVTSSVFESRVKHFFGTLEDMTELFVAGR